MNNAEGRASQYDRDDSAPGILEAVEGTAHQAILRYTVGLAFSIALTAASFYLIGTTLVWPPAIPVALSVLAIAQMGVHLVFFLRITTAPDNTNNVLALAFGLLIVGLIVAGSLWIMGHLHHNMAPMNAMPMRPD